MKKYKINKKAQMTTMTWIVAMIIIFFMAVIYLFFVGALMPKVGQTQQSIITELTGSEDLITLYNLIYYTNNNINKEPEIITKDCGVGLIDSEKSFDKNFVSVIEGDLYYSIYFRRAFLISLEDGTIKTSKYWRGYKC